MERVEYFAIGSMINPVSVSMRGLNPITSRPGILKNYELIFVKTNGMAAARVCDSSEIHGVLHRVTRAELDTLDKIESNYVVGKKVSIQLYNSEDQQNIPHDPNEEEKQGNDILEKSRKSWVKDVEGIVYVLNDQIVLQDPEKFSINTPNERYIDILKGGARHYGLNEEYVNRTFVDIEVIPRPTNNQLKKVVVPDDFYADSFPTCKIGSTRTIFESQYNEYHFLAINKKMCRTKIDKTWRFYNILQELGNKDIQGVFMAATKYCYEPKYGVPESYDQMCSDHRKQIEHILVTSLMSGDDVKRWEVVAKVIE